MKYAYLYVEYTFMVSIGKKRNETNTKKMRIESCSNHIASLATIEIQCDSRRSSHYENTLFCRKPFGIFDKSMNICKEILVIIFVITRYSKT